MNPQEPESVQASLEVLRDPELHAELLRRAREADEHPERMIADADMDREIRSRLPR